MRTAVALGVFVLGGCDDKGRTDDLDPGAPLTEPTVACPLDVEAPDVDVFATSLEQMYACLNDDKGPEVSTECTEPEWFWYSSPQPVEGSEKGVVGWQTVTCSLADFSGEIAEYEYQLNKVYTPTAKLVSETIPMGQCSGNNDLHPSTPVEATELVNEWLECEGWSDDYVVTCWGPLKVSWPVRQIQGRPSNGGMFIHCQAFNDSDTIILFPNYIVEFLYVD